MNKTIYIRDEDIDVWEKARELAGDKLSPIIVAGLRRFVQEKALEQLKDKGYERIIVTYYEANGLPRKKAFVGRWLFSPEEPHSVIHEFDQILKSALALTAKGNVVILSWWEIPAGSSGGYSFRTFPSLDAAVACNSTNAVACAAIEAIGVPVEELDI